tara:strand:- start:30992 stop:32365 length:1374 start_codon:yes stop_codon:yes gene_type:complete
MSERNKILNLHFKDFVKSYKGVLKVDPKVNLSDFNTISTDSRTIKKDDVFLALKGDSFDGNKFANEAIAKGCKFFITEDKNIDKGGILVDSTTKFLENLASFLITKNKNIKIFGITGTNGKTTTKELLSSILSKKFKILSTKGNFNNLIGLPLTIMNLTNNHEALVLEMGTNSEGEIRRLANIARPQFATITNIGKGHTEKLKNEKTVFHEKKDIACFFNSDSIFSFNFDNRFLKDYFLEIECKKISFGIKNKADVSANNISTNYSEFDLCYNKKNIKINLMAPGVHNIYNCLCSASLSIMAGLELEQIKNGIEEFAGIDNRFKIIKLKNGNVIINDTYNANPNSMQSAIEMTSKIFSTKEKIAILGDMLELGDLAEDEHIKIGKEISDNGFKELYAYGDNSENYSINLKETTRFIKILEHSQIIDFIDLDSITNTVILVKGSRGMRMEKIFDSLKI